MIAPLKPAWCEGQMVWCGLRLARYWSSSSRRKQAQKEIGLWFTIDIFCVSKKALAPRWQLQDTMLGQHSFDKWQCVVCVCVYSDPKKNENRHDLIWLKGPKRKRIIAIVSLWLRIIYNGTSWRCLSLHSSEAISFIAILRSSLCVSFDCCKEGARRSQARESRVSFERQNSRSLATLRCIIAQGFRFKLNFCRRCWRADLSRGVSRVIATRPSDRHYGHSAPAPIFVSVKSVVVCWCTPVFSFDKHIYPLHECSWTVGWLFLFDVWRWAEFETVPLKV